LNGRLEEKIHIHLRITRRASEQLHDLATAMNMPPSAVIGLAIAKMHKHEPLLKKRQVRKNQKDWKSNSAGDQEES
jgi:hypothetical protein